MPEIFAMFNSFSTASLALPGMSGFTAELIIFFGMIMRGCGSAGILSAEVRRERDWELY